ncbi:hypothetical protein WDW89_14840 [Deltaproteobacteria bacterium TL4]
MAPTQNKIHSNDAAVQEWVAQQQFSKIWTHFQEQEQHASSPQEDYYRLGNLFYESTHLEQAALAWKKSAQLSSTTQNQTPLVEPQPLYPLKYLFGRAISSTLLIIFGFYLLIFTFFPRHDQLTLERLLSAMAQKHQSAWDRFWNSERPSHEQRVRYMEADEVWPHLLRKMEEMFGAKAEEQGSVASEFLEWLQKYNQGLSPEEPVNYYLLAGKGFFNDRKFDDAIQTYKEGLRVETSRVQLGKLYQELATTYYYQGYQLEPDGLATYNLPLIKASIKAYHQAEEYVEGPYLYGNMGWGYYLIGNFDKSIYYSNKALELTPELNYVRMNLGITFIRMFRYQNAFEAYDSISKYQPDVTEYEGGIRDLKELDRETPGKYPFIHFILGYLYFAQDKYALAQQEILFFLGQPFPEALWKQKAQWLLKHMERQVSKP